MAFKQGFFRYWLSLYYRYQKGKLIQVDQFLRALVRTLRMVIATSIGLAYTGGLDDINGKAKDTRTEAQKASLIKILKVLKNIYPQASIHGHRDYSPDKDGDGVEEHEFMKQCALVSQLRNLSI